MLSDDDRSAIEGLFDRLAAVERRGPDRDPEAEALIRRELSRQPAAPYYMAQTVLMQEHALGVAEERIAELERQLSGLGAHGAPAHGREAGYRDEQGVTPRGPWGSVPREANMERNTGQRGFGGGGFLAGAAQTAMGVAGGVLLGQAIGGLFGAGAAQASDASSPVQPVEQPQDYGNDQQDVSGDSGDFGGHDFGGFDTGGDF